MKFNKKQRKIMRLGATVLFCVVLISLLKIVFFNRNSEKTESYVGVWMIGYKYYSDATKENLLYELTSELHLLRDKTFYTKNASTDESKDGTAVKGTYKVDGNEITLTYDNNGKERIEKIYIDGNKLCLSKECVRYYTKDKLEVYFDIAVKSNNGEN